MTYHQQRQHQMVPHQMAPVAERQPNGSTINDDPDNNYPPGYRFSPYDEELVHHYLVDYMNRRQSHNQPPVASRPTRRRHNIPEVDIYKLEDPNVIKEKFPLGATSNKDEWYFFTPLSRKYPKGDRPSRTCGDNAGFWKPTGKDKDIIVGGVSAKRKCLEYLQGKPPGRKTDWKMHEYKLDTDDDQSGHKNKKLCPALCRIYLNTRKKDKNDDDQEVEGGGGGGSDVAQKGESETGSNKSPIEGEVVVDDQVINSSNANANQVVADDQNVYLDDQNANQLELDQNANQNVYDYGFVDSYNYDEGVMDPDETWYNVGQLRPESYSTLLAYDPYFDDPTPPQI